jgi:hypothetical protein
VVPYVYYREPPAGPNAGKILQPYVPTAPSGSAAHRSLGEVNP